VGNGGYLSMHRRTAESRSAQSESFNQLFKLRPQQALSAIPIRLPHQAYDAVQSIRTEPSLECPKVQTVLTRYLRQRHAIFQTRAQQPEAAKSKLTRRLGKRGQRRLDSRSG